MSLILVLGLAIALAMDCFAVSMGLACGLKGLTARQAVRMALFFAGFQFGMPILGWFAGESVVRFTSGFDHWLAFGLLAGIGGRMIYESFHLSDEEKACRPDQTKGARLLVLSVATSLDALAVGLSLGVLHQLEGLDAQDRKALLQDASRQITEDKARGARGWRRGRSGSDPAWAPRRAFARGPGRRACRRRSSGRSSAPPRPRGRRCGR